MTTDDRTFLAALTTENEGDVVVTWAGGEVKLPGTVMRDLGLFASDDQHEQDAEEDCQVVDFLLEKLLQKAGMTVAMGDNGDYERSLRKILLPGPPYSQQYIKIIKFRD
jgi:hypothetical protein